MKKIILVACCMAVTVLAQAQGVGVWKKPGETGYHTDYLIDRLVKKATTQWKNHQNLPWAKSVEHQHHKSEPNGLVGMNTLKHLSSPQRPRIPQGVSSLYYGRLNDLQVALADNPVLRYYRIISLRPADMVQMTPEQVDYVKGFLKAPVKVGEQDKRYTPRSVEELEHFLVKIELRAPHTSNSVFLIVNCYTREIYIAYANAKLPGVPLEPIAQKLPVR